MKKFVFGLITIAIALVIALVAGEMLIRLLDPQATLYPRYKYSEGYGAVLYENTVMVHRKPGHYSYSYHINKFGYRGRAVPISNRYDRTNIVVLGDSYGFGTGVHDGEEFSAVIEKALEPRCNVINLSVGGYGLTQQIRRFYEFGRLYDPQIVILQFCANDPADNLFNRVTEVENGRFVFRETTDPVAWVKKYLSRSRLQKSQLYNFLRFRAFALVRGRKLDQALIDMREETPKAPAAGDSPPGRASAEEIFYNRLLEAFAIDLAAREIRLIMISVNGHVERFDSIFALVNELQEKGALEYHDVRPWFAGITDYRSPEGHSWGAKAHALIGGKLAEIIRPAVNPPSSAPQNR